MVLAYHTQEREIVLCVKVTKFEVLYFTVPMSKEISMRSLTTDNRRNFIFLDTPVEVEVDFDSVMLADEIQDRMLKRPNPNYYPENERIN